jgi:hypothetical protein
MPLIISVLCSIQPSLIFHLFCGLSLLSAGMVEVPGSSGEQRPVYVCAYDGSDDCEVVQLSLLEALAYFAPFEQPLQPGQPLPFADLELQGQAEDARLQLLHSMELVSSGRAS